MTRSGHFDGIPFPRDAAAPRMSERPNHPPGGGRSSVPGQFL